LFYTLLPTFNMTTMRKATLLPAKSALLFLFAGIAPAAFAQTILFNNGAQVYTGPTTIVQVNGGFQNDGATAVFENNGTMTVANSGTPGTVFLTNGSTLQGDGTLRVQQDWVNDATFNSGTNSTVVLFGDLQQFITSTTGTNTTFNILTLQGTGIGNNRKKTLQLVDASVGPNGLISINDRELETLTNTFFVLNPSPVAVLNNTTVGSEGFVSSSFGGTFSRATNSTGVYRFPTGSSAGTLRYRPVTITPASAAANVYTARLGNNTATVDGFDVLQFDTSMCRVTSLFYHQINRTAGTDNAGIDVFYDLAADGPWDGLAQWNTPTAALWNNIGAVTQTTAVPFNDILKVNWSDFSNSPYILARYKLAEPLFACNDVCANSSGNVFNASGAPVGAGYTWTTPAGTTITSGQGSGSVTVDWNSASGPITVTSTNAVGCYSDPVSCTVNVSVPPVADFDTTSTGFDFTFSDLSTGGATSWSWDFGDGSTSNSQNPTHQFTSNGPQTVCLIATNSTGCADSICKQVFVDVTEYINIPNVFTPDGDGTNDYFFIDNTGLKEYSLDIYNRWGVKVFEGATANISWDGRSTSGVPMSDGTYFYILKAVTVTGKDYSQEGFINLIRGK
jgi:gliding motility-associated-like protein